jgi:flagellar hook-length control protein FliK
LPAAAPVPLAGVAVKIAGKALEGKNRFDIRLDPPELGRIDVRLDVDRDGRVTSHLIADRQDTLNLLQRDASGLQRALQDAGLKTADNGLQFSLRDQPNSQQQDTADSRTAQLVIPDETLNPVEPTSSGYSQLARLRGGLDIRV